MTSSTIIILILIGFFAGILSGFVGIGGGVIIVPALVFFLGLSQHEAQGTSLFVLMMPVVGLAVYNYWRENSINWNYGFIIALAFVIGGFFGSKISLKLSPSVVKLAFGLIMAYVSLRLILSGFNALKNGN
ncbi:MAG: TSUP family transporter [Flavobacteriia bacterium]|jgi:uncharacterized membrane protein YfcA